MLVRFSCNAHSDVMMFGDIAKRLLSMMGHSGTIPSAIAAEDVPQVLECLKQAIANESALASGTDADEEEDIQAEQPITIAVRAFPLIELMTAAVEAECGVTWYQQ